MFPCFHVVIVAFSSVMIKMKLCSNSIAVVAEQLVLIFKPTWMERGTVRTQRNAPG